MEAARTNLVGEPRRPRQMRADRADRAAAGGEQR